MNRAFLALAGILISLPSHSATLKQAEDAILGLVETSDFYVFGQDGFFKEPCSAEVEVDNNVFRLTVIKLSSQRKIDIEFNKRTGRMPTGEQVSVAKIETRYKKLQIAFNVQKPGQKKPAKIVLKIESNGNNKKGDHVAQVDLKLNGTNLGCKGIEN